jgi:hypothetical protein
MLYYILAILIFFYALYGVSTEGGIKKAGKLLSGYTAFFILSAFIVLSGMRWETGTDWQPYYTFFLKNNTWKEYRGYQNGQFEILYTLLNYLVKLVTNSYTVFLFVLAILTILLKYVSIEKIALYPALTFFLFYCGYIGDIFPVRQTLAVSILMVSIYFIHKKRKLPFICLVAVAVAFHLSAILWVFSYYIYHKKFGNRFILFFLILAFIIGQFGIRLYLPLLNMFSKRLGNLGKILNRLIVYLSGQYDDGSYSLLRNILALIKRMFLIPIFLVLRKKINISNDYANGLLNLYLFGTVFYLLFAMNINFAPLQRMSVPFVLLEIFLLPIILKIIRAKYMKFIYLDLLLLYGLTKLYSALNAYYDLYVPYRSILG